MPDRPVRSCVAFVVLCLGLTGCYFTSEHPLPKSPKLDRDLLGWWRTVPEDPKDPPGYLLFLEDRDKTLQVVVLEGEYSYNETYRGFCSELNRGKYLDLRKLSLDAKTGDPVLAKEHTLVHYRVVGRRRLELSLLNEDLFKQAVKEGRLQGRLSNDGNDLVLTDSTEHLAAFIRGRSQAEIPGKRLATAVRVTRLP